jgi:hypothetical protein
MRYELLPDEEQPVESVYDEDDEQPLVEDDVVPELDEDSASFVDQICVRTVMFVEEFCGVPFYPYQREFSYRIVESLVLNDAEEITGLLSRQSGKTETLANTLAGCMVLFPKLALTFEIMERFKAGLMVGCFAPTEEQSETLHGRIVDRLTSDRAVDIMLDPEIDDATTGRGKLIKLKNGSYARRQTANPKAKIEGKSYHIIVLDEAQDADDGVIRKSIHPMLSAYAGTIIKIGTPGYIKGDFYRAIQLNKRRRLNRRARQNHFEYDYKIVAKYNPLYARSVQKEKQRLGEDSDEFRMCVAPDTRVLTADLRHIPATEVVPGMKLVGFDEDRLSKGLHRNFRETEVEHVWRVTRPSYQIELDDGTSVVCSAEHPWLVSTAGRRTLWKTTESLSTTDRIFKLTDVWSEERSYETGYLAGVYDGEGSLSSAGPGKMILSFAQNEGGVLDRTRKYLADAGFAWWERTQPNGCVNLVIAGGRASVLRFLGQVRPERLLNKFNVEMLGSVGRHDRKSGGFDHPRITALVPLGDVELVAFQTSTRTFVAEGLASHNSYAIQWLLERGQLITDDDLDRLMDPSMPLVRSWHRSPCVAGIDPARIKDSTVVTVCWVDWQFPDPFGLCEHRVLDWLELTNIPWEEQYFQILSFLDNYAVTLCGVDATGMGSVVAERLQVLLGHRCRVIPMSSDLSTQSKRWKRLQTMLDRRMLVFPGHSKARRTRAWRRFRQQMGDAIKIFKQGQLLVAAPNEVEAHDDFVDSLCLAIAASEVEVQDSVEVFEAPFYERRRLG